jgi:EAL and modified HD-GYP domain-containing signal transduction protein
MIAYQKIVDREGRIFAEELLYRNLEGERALDGLTSREMTQFCLDHFNARTLALVNVGPQELDLLITFRKGLGIELLEGQQWGHHLIPLLSQLKRDHLLLLDDWSMTSHPEWMFDLCDYVKIEMTLPPEKVQGLFQQAMVMGKMTLAEKVETRVDFQYAYQLGFHLFQGYFLGMPELR